MSAAPAAAAADATDTTDATDAVPAAKGKKKKLIVIGAVVAVLLAGGGGAAVFMMKKRAAAAAAEGGGENAAAEHPKPDVKHAPTFVPLDPFTVNLADRQAERFAQVGVTLELTDAKAGDLLKAYMPAIRNNILLVLGSKTAAQLIERDGKLLLAAEIRREALRPLGYEVKLEGEGADAHAPAEDEADDAGDTDEEKAKAKKKAKPKAHAEDEQAPIRAVHFSNFIIQ